LVCAATEWSEKAREHRVPQLDDSHDVLYGRPSLSPCVASRALSGSSNAPWEQASEHVTMLDKSATMLLDGTVRLPGLRMRRDPAAPAPQPPPLDRDLYVVSPLSRTFARWRPIRRLLRGRINGPQAPALHRSLPKGRHRLGAEVVGSVKCERIAYATAESIQAEGYGDVTVADIGAPASVSRDVFHARFHDKRDGFGGTTNCCSSEQLPATMAGALFASSDIWPACEFVDAKVNAAARGPAASVHA
jgi:hypothetical protein